MKTAFALNCQIGLILYSHPHKFLKFEDHPLTASLIS